MNRSIKNLMTPIPVVSPNHVYEEILVNFLQAPVTRGCFSEVFIPFCCSTEVTNQKIWNRKVSSSVR